MILALNGFVPFDYGIPYQMFALARAADGEKAYAVSFAGPDAEAESGGLIISGVMPLDELLRADTIIIPGIERPFEFHDESVFQALRKARDSGIRLASICTGACVLAASGVLDGMSATTHWEAVEQLAARYPHINVEPDVLFVDNGPVLTSAGLSSGIDLCLHLIRKDLGAAAAEALADFFVTPVEREAGQRQFVRRRAPQSDGNLAALQLWLLENMHKPLTLRAVCEQAHMSPRTLNRKFQEQLGAPPLTWLTRARVRRAQSLLETGELPLESVAEIVGFGSAAAFRLHFRRIVGVSPTAWRKTYMNRRS